jgi:hypothetical protein
MKNSLCFPLGASILHPASQWLLITFTPLAPFQLSIAVPEFKEVEEGRHEEEMYNYNW